MRDTERTGSVPDPLIRRMADQASSAMVLTCGPENRIIYANRAFVRLTGRQPASVHGAGISEVLPGVDLSALEEACRTKEPVSRSGQPLFLPPGEGTTWWDFCSICLDDTGPDGTVVMTSAQEVTDHVAARRDAEAAQATLDALMAHIPEGITIARGPGVQVERVSAHGRALTRKTIRSSWASMPRRTPRLGKCTPSGATSRSRLRSGPWRELSEAGRCWRTGRLC